MDNFMTIGDYEVKQLLVADFVNHTDGKVDFRIVDSDWETVLFEGRQEELAWTHEGGADPLCSRIVDQFDITHDGIIVLYLEQDSMIDDGLYLLGEGV